MPTQKITSFFKAGPKPENVDSDKGVKRKLSETDLGDEDNNIQTDAKKLAQGMGSSWLEALRAEVDAPYFSSLGKFVANERKKGEVFPSHEDLWTWTTRTDIKDTRVVILGQDPYPTPGHAHGLCFSVTKGTDHPRSLKNIFKELESDVEGFTQPTHGYLGGWADQGVLLLNAVLTVRSGEANSHQGRGWERFTDAVIRWISTNCEGVVFMLWGGAAQKKAARVDSSRHHILRAAHPSPLSANRGGWFGSKHFTKCNALLEAGGKQPVDWARL